jgi:hypothetical protein
MTAVIVAMTLIAIAIIGIGAYAMLREPPRQSNAGLIGGGVGQALSGILGAAGIS